jgi:hypothetical protein
MEGWMDKFFDTSFAAVILFFFFFFFAGDRS